MSATLIRALCCLLLASGSLPVLQAAEEEAGSADPAEVRQLLGMQEDQQASASASQQRIEALDDEALAMISDYNRELARYEDLLTYNDNMRQLLASQSAEKARLAEELLEVEVVRRSIVPLMVEMVDILEQFIGLDKPVLMEERNARLTELKSVLTRSDVEIAEKYRRVIEAYQIEAEYGQTIEAYEGAIVLEGRDLTVDFLRVGRVALYYLSLDRQHGALWNPAQSTWHDLGDQQLDNLDFAVRVARKQAPPNLVQLPLWTREDGS